MGGSDLLAGLELPHWGGNTSSFASADQRGDHTDAAGRIGGSRVGVHPICPRGGSAYGPSQTGPKD